MGTAELIADYKVSDTGIGHLGEQPNSLQVAMKDLATLVSKKAIHMPAPAEILPSARKSRILFGALNDPNYRLLKPIPLDVSIEENNVLLTWSEVDEYGCGDSTSSALEDFGHTLRELYRHLNSGVQLGPDLLKVKVLLGNFIEPRSR
jgi:hypothetical protein